MPILLMIKHKSCKIVIWTSKVTVLFVNNIQSDKIKFYTMSVLSPSNESTHAEEIVFLYRQINMLYSELFLCLMSFAVKKNPRTLELKCSIIESFTFLTDWFLDMRFLAMVSFANYLQI